jgi:hypothetical protein
MEANKWKPGQSGNPTGRPKKHLLSGCYEALIEHPLPEDLRVGLKLKKGATWGDAIVLGQARAAIKGKTEAAREIADRVEGKVAQAVEIAGADGGPIVLQDLAAGRQRVKEWREKRSAK